MCILNLFITGDCVSNCIDMPDGKYASCYACNVYTDCKDGVLKYKSCHHEYEFDYTSRECTESGSTCTGKEITDTEIITLYLNVGPMILVSYIDEIYMQ